MVSLGCARLPSLNEPEVPNSISVIMGYVVVEGSVAVLGDSLVRESGNSSQRGLGNRRCDVVGDGRCSLLASLDGMELHSSSGSSDTRAPCQAEARHVRS